MTNFLVGLVSRMGTGKGGREITEEVTILALVMLGCVCSWSLPLGKRSCSVM